MAAVPFALECLKFWSGLAGTSRSVQRVMLLKTTWRDAPPHAVPCDKGATLSAFTCSVLLSRLLMNRLDDCIQQFIKYNLRNMVCETARIDDKVMKPCAPPLPTAVRQTCAAPAFTAGRRPAAATIIRNRRTLSSGLQPQ